MTSKARARRARSASAGRRRQASRNERGNGRAGNAARAAAVGTVRPADGRRLLKVIGLAVGLTLAAIGLIVYLFGVAHVWYGLHDISDTTIYADYAARMAQGLRPYVDFPVEYPPLAIPLFVIPGHSGNVASYSDWFNVEMFVMCAAAAAATAAAAARLWTTGRKAYLVGVAFAACVLATGAIVGNRYDAAVALVLAVFLLLIAYEMWTVSALVLGIGFALKLTPAILLPLVFVLAVRRQTIAWSLVYFVLAAVLPFVPFMVHGLKGLEYPFTYQLHRPLQVESVLAAPLLLGHVLNRVWVEVGSTLRLAVRGRDRRRHAGAHLGLSRARRPGRDLLADLAAARDAARHAAARAAGRPRPDPGLHDVRQGALAAVLHLDLAGHRPRTPRAPGARPHADGRARAHPDRVSREVLGVHRPRHRRRAHRGGPRRGALRGLRSVAVAPLAPAGAGAVADERAVAGETSGSCRRRDEWAVAGPRGVGRAGAVGPDTSSYPTPVGPASSDRGEWFSPGQRLVSTKCRASPAGTLKFVPHRPSPRRECLDSHPFHREQRDCPVRLLDRVGQRHPRPVDTSSMIGT